MSAGPVQQLRHAVEDLTVAARRECIEPEGPLGAWVEAQRIMLTAMADVVAHQEGVVHRVGVEMKQVAAGELAKLNIALRTAEHVLLTARGAVNTLEAERMRVAAEMISSVAPQIVQGVRDAVVIREIRYNKSLQWKRAGSIATAMLMLMIGGYIWRMVEDWSDSTIISIATTALERCHFRPTWKNAEGEVLCPLADFEALIPYIPLWNAPVVQAPPPPPAAPPQPSAWQFPGAPPNGPVKFHD